VKVALTIAGSDSGGGAGIQADLAVLRDLGVWGVSAITCVTAQTPDEVTRVEALAPGMVAEQIAVVSRRFPISAVKIGMTYSAPIVTAIATALQEHLQAGTPVVLDPVMRSTSGAPLLQPGGEEALCRQLLPLATVITPNLAEAEALAGMESISALAEMEEAAHRIAERTTAAVLVKGGHLDTTATDVVLANHRLSHLHGKRIATGDTHGTGCSLAAAITAGMARGLDLLDAIREAKAYVSALIEQRLQLGPDGPWGLGFGLGRDALSRLNGPADGQ
jgi:hydroxymethylpyrimidine/phosphomethylpyrimidine kinase